MNPQNPNQRQKKGNSGGRAQGGSQGGGKSGGKGGGKKRGKKRGKKKQNNSAIDSKRPLWENPAGEAEVREVVGLVRPAHHPTAVVRSLGDPPLGKYASSAQL